MFFSRYVEALGPDADAVWETLDAPPRLGRYMPFSTYPLTDYLRWFDLVARSRYAGSAVREAYRLLARAEVDVFVKSTLGRVTFSLLSDPAATLLKYPESFGVLAFGPKVSAVAEGAGVRITFDPYRGAIEYAIGVLEGLVMAFAAEPAIELEVADAGTATFLVTWSEAHDRPAVSSRRGASDLPPVSSRIPPPRSSRRPPSGTD